MTLSRQERGVEGGQQMESGVEGRRNVETERKMDQVEETRGDGIDEWIQRNYNYIKKTSLCYQAHGFNTDN